MTKKEIYAAHGIQYNPKNNKLYHPVLGYIRPVLVNGNKKIGKGAWHFSTLPGTAIYTVIINGASYDIKGTCPCDCIGCYAKSGNYRYQSVKNALGIRTWLARNDIEFLENAINAQIEADKIQLIRIHAAGDFASVEYLIMWTRIVRNHPAVTFWTYSKVESFEAAFDGFNNANIVKSIVPHYGINFGHCDYIIGLYKALKAAGKRVHICRCGIDKEQHCTNCTACSECEYVLFLEHSTEYKAEQDALYPEFVALVESQENEFIKKAA